MKGFEKFLSQIMAEGTREEMKILDDMVGEDGDKENEPPPRKRKRTWRMAFQPRKLEL